MLTISGIGVVAAFLAGAISFLSPCCLPLVPGYVSFIAGQPDLRQRRSIGGRARLKVLGLSSCFVLGFSTVLIGLGAAASLLGKLLMSWRAELGLLGGAVIVAFGLMMLGLFRLPVLTRDTRFHLDIPGGRPLAAYLLGLAFAFGWTPCIGPILGAILTLSANTGGLSSGVWLLAIYSAGLGVPFLLTALFTDVVAAKIKMVGRAGRVLYTVSGLVLVVMGVAVMTGQMTRLAYWLLETFPVLNATLA